MNSDLQRLFGPQLMDSQRRPLTPDEEARFQTDMAHQPAYQDWAAQFAKRFGEPPNLNDPQYDYRTAWRYGSTPQPYAPDNGFPHWQSSVQAPPFAEPLPLKQPEHPTEWMERAMQATGVDPHTLPPDAFIAAQRQYGLSPIIEMFGAKR